MNIEQWCQVHWDQLRQVVEARGLGHLISQEGAAAAARVADELRLGAVQDREGFDPLLRAWAMINSRALGMLPPGSPLIERCPLCLVADHHCANPQCFADKSPEEWIEGCVESLHQYASTLKLLREDGKEEEPP